MSQGNDHRRTVGSAPGFTAGSSVYASRQRYGRAPSASARAGSRPAVPETRLQAYDPRWPGIFEAERRRIQASLGSLARAIEHVGSSSIRGLAGRAEIDILVGVAGDRAVVTGARRLTALGYVVQSRSGDEWSLLARTAAVPFELLLVEHGGALFKRHVALRDHLLRDPARAARYARHKARWAARYGTGTAGYKLAKRRYWAAVRVPGE